MKLEICTKSRVTFKQRYKSGSSWNYDVSCDAFGLPQISLVDELRERCGLSEEITIGFARPAGYIGIVLAVNEIDYGELSSKVLSRRFIEEDADSATGLRVRALRPGIVLEANMEIPPDLVDETREKLEASSRLGADLGGGEGIVSFSLKEDDLDHRDKEGVLCDSHAEYGSLDYSLLLISDACFERRYAEDERSYLYVPGAYVRQLFLKKFPENAEEVNRLVFSNAYINIRGERFLPVPDCVAVIKQDKTQLRYRLSAGKDPRITEQDLGIAGRYCDNVEAPELRYTKPLTERVVMSGGLVNDALCSGQVFSGGIHGDDRTLRMIARKMSGLNREFIGDHTEDGFGECVFRLEKAHVKQSQTSGLFNRFDVRCVSPLFIMNEVGLSSLDSSDIVKELERVLEVEDMLEIEGLYTKDSIDYGALAYECETRGVVRTFSKGSVLRIRVKDEKLIDISPIVHCFIGERVRDGYGEIMAYPAIDNYYRRAVSVVPEFFDVNMNLVPDLIYRKASVQRQVLEDIVEDRVSVLADIDKGNESVCEPPLDVLSFIRDSFVPTLSLETLVDWYKERWES